MSIDELCALPVESLAAKDCLLFLWATFPMLPEALREIYTPLVMESDEDLNPIVKAADKLSAYIKCVEELKAGNSEFEAAEKQTRQALTDMHLPCLDYFMAHFLDSFRLTLDELE